jgi:hypothetical protein
MQHPCFIHRLRWVHPHLGHQTVHHRPKNQLHRAT